MKLTFKREYASGPFLWEEGWGEERRRQQLRQAVESSAPSTWTSMEEKYNEQREILYNPIQTAWFSLFLAEAGAPAESSSLGPMQSSSLKTDKQHFVSI